MRSVIVAGFAAALIAAPAAAQGWREYSYPGFAVQFPANPNTTMGSFRTNGGAQAPATIYAAEAGQTRYSMTVADYTNLAAEQRNAIDDAVKTASADGMVTVTVRARINGEFGQELNIANKDGSLSTLAIFYVGKKLYQLEARIAPPNPKANTGAAIRFQQSLRFTG